MISCLGNYLDRKFHALPEGANVQDFLQLLLLVVQSQSLVVSIPVLVTWTRILRNNLISGLVDNPHLIGNLLEVCSLRLIRYESLPEDTEDPTYLLLMEDTDTVPERHAFLGNYRRYSSQVIESIVQLKLADAFYHILTQAENVLGTLYDGQPPLDGKHAAHARLVNAPPLIHRQVTKYSKNSMSVLKVDAHFTVVESALKGYVKWRSARRQSPEEVRSTLPAWVNDSRSKRWEQEQKGAALEADFEGWCNRLLDMKVEVRKMGEVAIWLPAIDANVCPLGPPD